MKKKEALFLKWSYEASVLSERKVTKRELSTVRLSPKRKRPPEEKHSCPIYDMVHVL